MLLFKKKFMAAIRSGEKTQTIRLWKVCRMKSGQRSYIPGAGYIRVLSVEPVELAALTDDDARPDGFASADALRHELADALRRPTGRRTPCVSHSLRVVLAAKSKPPPWPSARQGSGAA